MGEVVQPPDGREGRAAEIQPLPDDAVDNGHADHNFAQTADQSEWPPCRSSSPEASTKVRPPSLQGHLYRDPVTPVDQRDPAADDETDRSKAACQLRAATDRPTGAGALLNPDERVSMTDALRLTQGMLRSPATIRTLDVGAAADIAVLASDWNDLESLPGVRLTIIGGRIVHDAT